MYEGQKAIVWFNEVTKKDIPIVGGKGANLGEMTNAHIPVLSSQYTKTKTVPEIKPHFIELFIGLFGLNL